MLPLFIATRSNEMRIACRGSVRTQDWTTKTSQTASGSTPAKQLKNACLGPRVLSSDTSLNLLKAEKSAKVGVKVKRLKCGWNEDYLLKVLLGPQPI